MPKYYELTIGLKTQIRKIKIISNDENFSKFRIERELFGKGKVQEYKIIKSEIIKENLGLVN